MMIFENLLSIEIGSEAPHLVRVEPGVESRGLLGDRTTVLDRGLACRLLGEDHVTQPNHGRPGPALWSRPKQQWKRTCFRTRTSERTEEP